ncbi:hypothetical protein KM043_000538 [Ampulex compressa]|nr:hypothetical protein KM043_000538 [Ampulex compressa]
MAPEAKNGGEGASEREAARVWCRALARTASLDRRSKDARAPGGGGGGGAGRRRNRWQALSASRGKRAWRYAAPSRLLEGARARGSGTAGALAAASSRPNTRFVSPPLARSSPEREYAAPNRASRPRAAHGSARRTGFVMGKMPAVRSVERSIDVTSQFPGAVEGRGGRPQNFPCAVTIGDYRRNSVRSPASKAELGAAPIPGGSPLAPSESSRGSAEVAWRLPRCPAGPRGSRGARSRRCA